MDIEHSKQALDELASEVNAEISAWNELSTPEDWEVLQNRLSEKRVRVQTLQTGIVETQQHLRDVVSNPEPLIDALNNNIESIRKTMDALVSAKIPGLNFSAENIAGVFEEAAESMTESSLALLQVLNDELPEFLADTEERSREQATSLQEEMEEFCNRVSESAEEAIANLQQAFSSLEDQSESNRNSLSDLQLKIADSLREKLASINNEMSTNIVEATDKFTELARNLKEVQVSIERIMQAAQSATQASGVGMNAGANALVVVKDTMETVG